jgi:hypothetical protein
LEFIGETPVRYSVLVASLCAIGQAKPDRLSQQRLTVCACTFS